MFNLKTLTFNVFFRSVVVDRTKEVEVINNEFSVNALKVVHCLQD